jgi:type I restriction enzyme M protein
MSDEQSDGPVPVEYGWSSFAGLEPKEMHQKYGQALASLSGASGMLGLIFSNARNKIKDPAKLRLLVSGLIGQTAWTGLSADLKGDAYEGLLEKNARDTKSGAGQYFTLRALVRAIVECVDPRLGEVVADPACGTGGFLLAAHQYLQEHNPEPTLAEGSISARRPSAVVSW